eukprot:444690-Amorphochlora_amoeboformis.AAC.1
MALLPSVRRIFVSIPEPAARMLLLPAIRTVMDDALVETRERERREEGGEEEGKIQRIYFQGGEERLEGTGMNGNRREVRQKKR